VATVLLACEAMATRFEFVLHGRRAPSVRGAGEEAIDEIRRIDAALSLYRPESQVSAINRDAAHKPVRVAPEVFRLIEHALRLSQATHGAFDITVAPLLRTWGMMRAGAGQIPSEQAIEAARACVGYSLVEMDPGNFQVAFRRPGVLLDLGSIGKGYALDRAAELLREAGIASGLIHGGTSTAIAIWQTPEGSPWKVAIDSPPTPGPAAKDATKPSPLAVVELRDESLSVSAVWGKGFEANGRFFGHVIDPRHGAPVTTALLAAIVLPLATESDAISTALLVRGREMLEILGRDAHGPRCLVLEPASTPRGYKVASNGISTSVE
jgi:thiamine biosynthesis lipoprotein